MTPEEIQSNASILLLAGGESTATSLNSLTYQIASNPEALAKVTHEIRSAFKHEDEITIRSTKNLPYLCAAILESMRLMPAVAEDLPRVIAPGGTTLLGQFIPGGVS